jgi:hypothetical protein
MNPEDSNLGKKTDILNAFVILPSQLQDVDLMTIKLRNM